MLQSTFARPFEEGLREQQFLDNVRIQTTVRPLPGKYLAYELITGLTQPKKIDPFAPTVHGKNKPKVSVCNALQNFRSLLK